MSRLAAAQTPPDFNIPRIIRPPTIDGVVEANEWKEATRIPCLLYTSDAADE